MIGGESFFVGWVDNDPDFDFYTGWAPEGMVVCLIKDPAIPGIYEFSIQCLIGSFVINGTVAIE